MIFSPSNTGWIEVICGPMFSGKTEELIRRMRRAQIAKQRVAIFKPHIDDRYDSKNIVSHTKMALESHVVQDAKEIINLSVEAQVVGIDEAQFFDETIIHIAKRLANGGKRVIVAGLDKDYMARPFGSMPHLMLEAEYVTKVLSICMKCGNPANFSQRLSHDSGQVVVGETDKYEARCRRCYQD